MKKLLRALCEVLLLAFVWSLPLTLYFWNMKP